MEEERVFDDISNMVAAFFSGWGLRLAASAGTEDKIRCLSVAGDYGTLFDSLWTYADGGVFGEEMKEKIDDFLLMRSPTATSTKGGADQHYWDESVLALLLKFKTDHCD